MAFQEFSSHDTVNAEQIEETRSVITPNGPITAYPGQWEVRYPDGNVRVIDDDAFQEEWGSGGDESAEDTTQPEVSGIGGTVAPATVSSDSGTDESDILTTDDVETDSSFSPDSGSAPVESTTVPTTATAEQTAPSTTESDAGDSPTDSSADSPTDSPPDSSTESPPTTSTNSGTTAATDSGTSTQ